MLNLDLNKKIELYNNFIDLCYVEDRGYRLTPQSEISPYALCFAIYGKFLINKLDTISKDRKFFADELINNLNQKRKYCIKNKINLCINKSYLQLLTFTLSALSVLDLLELTSINEHVEPLVNKDISKILSEAGTYSGKAGTGNLAMFYAILLIHSQKFIKINIGNKLERWVEDHLNNMNNFGFWGEDQGITHLQFQNGYHQYEIFEYLNIKLLNRDRTIEYVASLVDSSGHFAPYPGGGGCYDYDAVFILTSDNKPELSEHIELLNKTKHTILSEQNSDGGFGESKHIRPINIKKYLDHVQQINGPAKLERMKYCLTLLRPKHNRIKTHWTKYSREWGESNLWDSWFRMLAVARICEYINKGESFNWGFIKYPGIGYHHE